jgi:hypothetical protein
MLYGHSHASAEERLDKAFPFRMSFDIGIDNAAKLLGEYRPFSFEDIECIMASRPRMGMDTFIEMEKRIAKT